MSTETTITFPDELENRLKEIKKKVDDYNFSNDDSFQTNARKIYSELELLRIDFQEDLYKQLRKKHFEETKESESIKNEKQNKKSHEEEEEEEEAELTALDKDHNTLWTSSPQETLLTSLRSPLSVRRKASLSLSLLLILKSISLILYLFLSFFVFFPLSSLRLLHPFFQKVFGIRNNFLPGDVIIKYYTGGFLTVLGTEVEVQNDKVLNLDEPTIGMFSHSSNYDAFIVNTHSPISFKWIGKTSIFWIPFLGWMGWAMGMIPINRSNINSAISTLNNAAKKARLGRRSIAISPEGTRSKVGLLGEFKKGPFHLTKNTGLTITPILIFGAFELYPPKQILPAPGKVVLRFLPSLKYESSLSLVENSLVVRRSMLKELANFPKETLEKRNEAYDLKSYFFISFLFCVTAVLLQGFL